MMIKEVVIPEGTDVSFENGVIKVTGPRGELSRKTDCPGIRVKIDKGRISFESESDRRRAKALAGTWASHARNMIDGVNHGFEARLKIVYSHFPMKFSVEGKKVILGNFLGGRKNREVEIRGEVEIRNEKDDVIVTGTNKEEVGQAASLIESMARVKGFDRRVFQDGIHLVQKATVLKEE
jgi:large subunit ribosomal protein L6